MNWLTEKLHKLQQQPYQTRKRLFWSVVIAAGVIIILLWLITLQLRPMERQNGPAKFNEIIENIKQLRSKNAQTE